MPENRPEREREREREREKRDGARENREKPTSVVNEWKKGRERERERERETEMEKLREGKRSVNRYTGKEDVAKSEEGVRGGKDELQGKKGEKKMTGRRAERRGS